MVDFFAAIFDHAQNVLLYRFIISAFKMKENTWLAIALLLSAEICIIYTETASCIQSRPTMTSVSSCPKNREDWDRRTVEKKCVLVSQECVPKEEFVYHCVLNVYANETLEVCAPKAQIMGKSCAEYNVLGAIIQQSQTKCNEMCPFKYNSTDAYKFQECYKKVARKYSTEESTISFQKENVTALFISNTSSSFQEDCIYSVSSVWQTVAILMITINVILLILIILLSKMIFCKRKQDTNDKHIEENQPFLENESKNRCDVLNLQEIVGKDVSNNEMHADPERDANKEISENKIHADPGRDVNKEVSNNDIHADPGRDVNKGHDFHNSWNKEKEKNYWAVQNNPSTTYNDEDFHNYNRPYY